MLKTPLQLFDLEPALSTVKAQFLRDPVTVPIRGAGVTILKLLLAAHRFVVYQARRPTDP